MIPKIHCKCTGTAKLEALPETQPGINNWKGECDTCKSVFEVTKSDMTILGSAAPAGIDSNPQE